MASDWERLEAWRGGDVDAGDDLVARYFRSLDHCWLVPFVTETGTDAEDLTTRTLLACARSRGRSPMSVRAHLYGVARGVLLARGEARPRPSDRGRYRDTAPGEGTPPPANDRRVEEPAQLLRTRGRLPVDHPLALQRFCGEKRSSREVSTVLDCPAGAVEARLSRGRSRLRQLVEAMPTSGHRGETAVSARDRWTAPLHPARGLR